MTPDEFELYNSYNVKVKLVMANLDSADHTSTEILQYMHDEGLKVLAIEDLPERQWDMLSRCNAALAVLLMMRRERDDE